MFCPRLDRAATVLRLRRRLLWHVRMTNCQNYHSILLRCSQKNERRKCGLLFNKGVEYLEYGFTLQVRPLAPGPSVEHAERAAALLS